MRELHGPPIKTITYVVTSAANSYFSTTFLNWQLVLAWRVFPPSLNSLTTDLLLLLSDN
jgi:hypothetical protein